MERPGRSRQRVRRQHAGDSRAQPADRHRPPLCVVDRAVARRRDDRAARQLMPASSVNFDRAAAVYDATRGFPAETERELAVILADELRDRGSCLEIGVGTGRMAIPLRRHGVDMYGVDISLAMLTELLRKRSGGPLPWISLADATDLPFENGPFGSALACHVLHLVGDWERAARELVRVVRPGGVVIAGLGGADLPIMRAIRLRLAVESGRNQLDPGIS